MISLHASGLKEVQKIFTELGKPELYTSTVQDVGKKAKQYAREYSPVDTGALRKSIFLQSDKEGFQLGAWAAHAVFNEYGSIRTPIGSVEAPIAAVKKGFRPFLRPAMYKAMREVDYIFGQKVAKIVSHGGKA